MNRTSQSARRTGDQRRGSVLSGVVMLLVVAAVAGGLGYYYYFQPGDNDLVKNLIIQPVERGSFDHIVLEQGEIESSSNTEIICEVKARTGGSGGTSILWVVDEGTSVKKGDKLVELDSSQLEQERKQQRIIVGNAEAAVTTAEAALEQAKIARQEYLEGVFMTEEKAIQSEMAVAEQELRKTQLALKSSERLVAKGLFKSLQLEADQFAVANARNQLEAAEGRLRVLQNLTRQKMLVQFDSDISAARANLEAVRGTLEEEKEKMAEIEQQIDVCVMYAPNDGVVVHANRYSSRGGNAEFVVEAGATVRERQTIIRLPDPSMMQVSAKINESRVTLVQEGMPAKIRVGALSDLELVGRVIKVNRYAEPGSYFSGSIKEYATTVAIIEPPPSIRTGMTAEVRIFVQQLPNVLQIPIQGVYEYGGHTYALIVDEGNRFETREVVVGATNDKMATIEDGLTEEDSIVLNLRQHLSLLELPELVKEDNSRMSEIRSKSAAMAEEDGPSGPPANEASSAPDERVDRIFERNDSDGDGTLSQSELDAIQGAFRDRIVGADEDGDGTVTREEMSKAAASMPAPGSGPPGERPLGNRPPGGGPSGQTGP